MDHTKSTYNRILCSSTAEQILSESKIHIDLDILRPHFIGKYIPKSSDLYKYMKNASQGGGYISTAYESKTKTTARMFTKKNHLNVINLSDGRVLDAMTSRYKGGKMVVLDYKAFEPSIIRAILGDVFPDDVHTWAEGVLGVDRKTAKKYNMELLYCSDFDARVPEILNELGASTSVMNYISRMEGVRTQISEFVSPHLAMYEQSGCVVNTFGRKIYPKEARNIFSNIVQSIGSEILVDAIINLNELLSGGEAHLLFHRFDALYFDMSRGALLSTIVDTIKTMGDSRSQIYPSSKPLHLGVGIQIGDSLGSLKDIDSGKIITPSIVRPKE